MDKEFELQTNKKILVAEITIFAISLIAFFALVIVAGVVQLPDWARVLLSAIALKFL